MKKRLIDSSVATTTIDQVEDTRVLFYETGEKNAQKKRKSFGENNQAYIIFSTDRSY